MTDFELKREVESELNWDPEVKSAAAIGVSVKDGIVTLRGHVDSFIEKLAAENAVTHVRGVKAVVNELEVRILKSSERTDEDLARAAVEAIAWLTEVPEDRIKIKVENGIITLFGTVYWNYQKQSAENAVRGLMGVKGVINLIEVRPSADKALVKAKIEEALKRNAELDAKSASQLRPLALRSSCAAPFARGRSERKQNAWLGKRLDHVRAERSQPGAKA